MPKVAMRLPALLPILFSIGCASSPPPAIEIRTVVIAPPAENLDCAPAPAVPATPATMEQLLVYMAQAVYAGEDCRARLAATRRSVEQAVADIE